MPGKTGKRARRPSPCRRCGQKIEGSFNREREGDYHQECWWAMRDDIAKRVARGEVADRRREAH